MIAVLANRRVTTNEDRRGTGRRRGNSAGQECPHVVRIRHVVGVRTAAVIVATTLLSGACSQDADPLTLDEYFDELEAIDDDVDARFEALFAGFPDDEDPFADEANLEAFKEMVTGFPNITGDLIDSAKGLDPPSELEDAHSHLIDRGEALLVAFERGTERLSAVETMAEFEAVMSEVGPDIDAAQANFDAACLDVLAIGVDNGIRVNVSCTDE